LRHVAVEALPHTGRARLFFNGLLTVFSSRWCYGMTAVRGRRAGSHARNRASRTAAVAATGKRKTL